MAATAVSDDVYSIAMRTLVRQGAAVAASAAAAAVVAAACCSERLIWATGRGQSQQSCRAQRNRSTAKSTSAATTLAQPQAPTTPTALLARPTRGGRRPCACCGTYRAVAVDALVEGPAPRCGQVVTRGGMEVVPPTRALMGAIWGPFGGPSGHPLPFLHPCTPYGTPAPRPLPHHNYTCK